MEHTSHISHAAPSRSSSIGGNSQSSHNSIAHSEASNSAPILTGTLPQISPASSLFGRFSMRSTQTATNYPIRHHDSPETRSVASTQLSSESDSTPKLIQCAKKGALDELRHLVENEQLDLGMAVDASGATALHWAAANGHVKVVAWLLKAGHIDPNARDSEMGETPLFWAVRHHQDDIVATLLEHDTVSLDIVNYEGRTAIDVAYVESNASLVGKLRSHALKTSEDDSGTPKLIQYAKKGALEELRHLIENEHLDPCREIDADGASALHWGAAKGHAKVVTWLLRSGRISVNWMEPKAGETALFWAIRHRQDEIVAILLGHKDIQVNLLSNGQKTVFDLAYTHSNSSLILRLRSHQLKKHPAPEVPGSYRSEPDRASAIRQAGSGSSAIPPSLPALSLAAVEGNKEEVARLLDEGVRPDDVRDSIGRSPLHWACTGGSADIAGLLLTHCDDPNMATQDGDTALHWAAKNGHADVVARLLEDECVSADTMNLASNTPLHHTENIGCVEHLVRKLGDNLNIRNENGETALMLAVMRNRTDIAAGLLSAPGIDVNLCNNTGDTALMAAAANGNLECVQLLMDAGANTDIQNNQGHTALLFAVGRGDFEAVKLLLTRAYANTEDKQGSTPIMEAVLGGHHDIAAYLISNRVLESSDDVIRGEAFGKLVRREIEERRSRDPEALADYEAISSLEKSLTYDSINVVGAWGHTALHYAVFKNDLRMLEILLKVKEIDPHATRHGYMPRVELSVREGHDVLRKEGHLHPLELAAREGHIDCFRRLLAMPGMTDSTHSRAEEGAGIPGRTESDEAHSPAERAFVWAVAFGWHEIVDLLLKPEYKVNPSIIDRKETSIDRYLLATIITDPSLVGNRPDMDDSDSKTSSIPNLKNRKYVSHPSPHDLATIGIDGTRDFLKVLALLMKDGRADPNVHSKGSSMSTPLHEAAYYRNVEAVKLLLKHPKIDTEVRNFFGETASDVAKKYGARDIVSVLDGHSGALKKVMSVFSLHKRNADQRSRFFVKFYRSVRDLPKESQLNRLLEDKQKFRALSEWIGLNGGLSGFLLQTPKGLAKHEAAEAVAWFFVVTTGISRMQDVYLHDMNICTYLRDMLLATPQEDPTAIDIALKTLLDGWLDLKKSDKLALLDTCLTPEILLRATSRARAGALDFIVQTILPGLDPVPGMNDEKMSENKNLQAKMYHLAQDTLALEKQQSAAQDTWADQGKTLSHSPAHTHLSRPEYKTLAASLAETEQKLPKDIAPLLRNKLEVAITYRTLFAEGIYLKQLPEGFAALPEMKALHLGRNRLSALPSDFCDWKVAGQICLQDNRLTSLPEGIKNMTQLKELNVANNKLIGLPEDYKQWPKTLKVNLKGNPLPPEVIDQLTEQFLRGHEIEFDGMFSSSVFGKSAPVSENEADLHRIHRVLHLWLDACLRQGNVLPYLASLGRGRRAYLFENSKPLLKWLGFSHTESARFGGVRQRLNATPIRVSGARIAHELDVVPPDLAPRHEQAQAIALFATSVMEPALQRKGVELLALVMKYASPIQAYECALTLLQNWDCFAGTDVQEKALRLLFNERLTELPPAAAMELATLLEENVLPNAASEKLWSQATALIFHARLWGELNDPALFEGKVSVAHVKGVADRVLAAWNNPRHTELSLAGCRLTRLPLVVRKLSHLSALDMSGNPLGDVPAGIDALDRLQHLKLERVGMTFTASDLQRLAAMPRLAWLQLGFNSIQQLPDDFAEALPHLELLWVNGNPLPSLDNLDFSDFTNFTHLNLQGTGAAEMANAFVVPNVARTPLDNAPLPPKKPAPVRDSYWNLNLSSWSLRSLKSVTSYRDDRFSQRVARPAWLSVEQSKKALKEIDAKYARDSVDLEAYYYHASRLRKEDQITLAGKCDHLNRAMGIGGETPAFSDEQQKTLEPKLLAWLATHSSDEKLQRTVLERLKQTLPNPTSSNQRIDPMQRDAMVSALRMLAQNLRQFKDARVQAEAVALLRKERLAAIPSTYVRASLLQAMRYAMPGIKDENARIEIDLVTWVLDVRAREDRGGAETIIRAAIQDPSMKRLSLKDQQLTGFPEMTMRRKLDHVTRLDLRGNQLEELPYFINHWTKLVQLQLGENPFFHVENVLTQLAEHPSLKEVDMTNVLMSQLDLHHARQISASRKTLNIDVSPKYMRNWLDKKRLIDKEGGDLLYARFLAQARQSASGATPQPLSVLYFDLDYFGSINKKHGEDVGNTALRTAVDQVIETLQEIDQRLTYVFTRAGGDEFMILMPDTANAKAKELAKQIGQAIANRLITHTDDRKTVELKLTTSMGLATYEPQAGDGEDAGKDTVVDAIRALRKAKIPRNAIVNAESYISVASEEEFTSELTYTFDVSSVVKQRPITSFSAASSTASGSVNSFTAMNDAEFTQYTTLGNHPYRNGVIGWDGSQKSYGFVIAPDGRGDDTVAAFRLPDDPLCYHETQPIELHNLFALNMINGGRWLMTPSFFTANSPSGMALSELVVHHNSHAERGKLALGKGAPSSKDAAFLDHVDSVCVQYTRSDCDARDVGFIRREGGTFLAYLRTSATLEVLEAHDMRDAVTVFLGNHALREAKVLYLYIAEKPAPSTERDSAPN